MKWLYTVWSICIGVVAVRADYRGVTLSCDPSNIRIAFDDDFLIRNKIDITTSSQLHFARNQRDVNCVSERVGATYTLTLWPPYTGCGTSVQHETDDYVYSNTVMFTTSTSNTVVMNMQCRYEDKYVVSSDIGLTPYVRTLNFVTGQGTLGVQISLYQRKDYHPKSKLGLRPSVLVGVPVYVSVDMDDVFGDDNIVTSLNTCYATTSRDFEIMDNYHYLITGRCASPTDLTVRILTNGESRKSRFSFEMFRWKNTAEYIYLHCEVKVCNRTRDVCTGNGSLCGGAVPWNQRKKREIDDNSRNVLGNTGFATLGPIRMGNLSSSGKPMLETSLEELPKDKRFLTAYIFGAVAVVLAVVGIALVVAVVFKKRLGRDNKRMKKNSPKTFSERYLPGMI